METLRQTAKVSRISDIIDGNFVRKEGMEPSYVLTKLGEKISRAKIVGAIINKFMSEDGNYSSATIDDDTDAIRVKAFKEDADFFDKFNVGDNVLLIGKVREYNGENYIIPEIMKKSETNYENYHKLKVLKQLLKKKKINDIVQKQKDKFADFEELKKYLVKKHKFDEKDIDSVLENISEKEEKILNSLLNNVESYITNLRNDRKKDRKFHDVTSKQKVVFWGHTNYGQVLNKSIEKVS